MGYGSGYGKKGLGRYQDMKIQTASPAQIMIMLYDGAIKNLEKSRVGLSEPSTSRSQEVGIALSKAMGIIGELRASLDHAAGGEISRYLDRLY